MLCMYVWMYGSIYVRMCVRTYVRMYIYIYYIIIIYTYIHTYTYTSTSTSTYTYTSTSTSTYTYTYIYIWGIFICPNSCNLWFWPSQPPDSTFLHPVVEPATFCPRCLQTVLPAATLTALAELFLHGPRFKNNTKQKKQEQLYIVMLQPHLKWESNRFPL